MKKNQQTKFYQEAQKRSDSMPVLKLLEYTDKFFSKGCG